MKSFLPILIPVLIFALLGWRMFRAMRGQAVRPNRLWIRPAMLTLLLVLAFLHPPAITLVSVAVFAAALVAGIGAGYLRAAHQTLSIDKVSGTITAKMSPIGSLLFVAVFGARFVVRLALQGGEAQPFKLQSGPALLVTNALLLFLVAMVAAMAWETWRRANRLLSDGISTGNGQEVLSEAENAAITKA